MVQNAGFVLENRQSKRREKPEKGAIYPFYGQYFR